jgi:hypothetical protein
MNEKHPGIGKVNPQLLSIGLDAGDINPTEGRLLSLEFPEAKLYRNHVSAENPLQSPRMVVNKGTFCHGLRTQSCGNDQVLTDPSGFLNRQLNGLADLPDSQISDRLYAFTDDFGSNDPEQSINESGFQQGGREPCAAFHKNRPGPFLGEDLEGSSEINPALGIGVDWKNPHSWSLEFLDSLRIGPPGRQNDGRGIAIG